MLPQLITLNDKPLNQPHGDDIEIVELLPAGKEPLRPSPDQIDDIALFYVDLKTAAARAAEELAEQEKLLVELVRLFGSVPANAEKSRRLTGRLADLTVTKSDSIVIVDERVEMLRDALKAAKRGTFFDRLFTQRSKWEMVEGAENALRTEPLPRRLAEKVLSLFGRCITPKTKKPSLKVTLTDPTQPAKKPRGKKGGAQ